MDKHVKTIPLNEKLTLDLVFDKFDFCVDKMVPIEQEHKDLDHYYNTSIDNKNDLPMMTTSNPIWLPADKHPQIAPKEYVNWIELHGNETTTTTNVDTKVTVKRKKSVLSTMSYQSDSSSSSDDDTTPPTTPTAELDYPALPEPENRQPQSRTKHLNKQQLIVTNRAVAEDDSKQSQKKSWLSGLFGDKKSKVKTLKKKTSISNFFSNKAKDSTPIEAKTSTEKKPVDKKKKKGDSKETKTVFEQPIPTRYAIGTERALYRLSHFKLNNPKRPLQQQVTISNMMYWYLSTTRQTTFMDQMCQATFEPPPPGERGGGDSSSHPPSITRSTSPPLPFVTAKNSKKKYKPVRNTEYSPVK